MQNKLSFGPHTGLLYHLLLILDMFPPTDMCPSSLPLRSLVPLGTFEYRAPEAARGQGYGPPADFWAAAVIIYELLTG